MRGPVSAGRSRGISVTAAGRSGSARPSQELRLEIREATATLTQQLARSPQPAELAEYLHVSEDQIADAQLASQAFQALSLDAPVSSEEGTASLGDLLGQGDPQLGQAIGIELVQAHWDELDAQCQLLLTLRFYGNMTQDELGSGSASPRCRSPASCAARWTTSGTGSRASQPTPRTGDPALTGTIFGRSAPPVHRPAGAAPTGSTPGPRRERGLSADRRCRGLVVQACVLSAGRMSRPSGLI